jgi:hypothetical protein
MYVHRRYLRLYIDDAFRQNSAGLANRLVGWLVDSCKLFTVLSSV